MRGMSYSRGAHHPTTTDLFQPSFFFSTVRKSTCDTSEKGRAIACTHTGQNTCKNVGAAECTERAEALPPSLLCIAAQTANHKVTSAT